MILELVLTPIFMLLNFLLDLFPKMPDVPNWVSSIIDLVSSGLYIFPAPIWALCLGSVVFWSFGQIGWRIVEWIYKKIPGVD